uniref:Uncharacterized protein n=1 Tax=Erpetoichthys calabaricus TaxID=27687 RepID=A0A8C4TAJ4_ERPCA
HFIFQFIQILCITMLIVSTCNCNPVINIIKGNLSLELSQDYNSELLLKERSLAPWTYEKKQDNERVPQVIYEAQCSTSHHCTIRSKNKTSSLYSLESVPIKAKIPVLRKKSS